MSRTSERFGGASGRNLLCARKDGLGARLANILWTWRLARTIDVGAVAFWPPMDPYYGEAAELGDVLDIERLEDAPLGEELRIADGRVKHHLRGRAVEIDPNLPCDPLDYVVELPRPSGTTEFAPVIQTCRGPILTHGESAEAASAEARVLFARLPLNPAVAEAVERAAREQALSHVVAIHVRRGDIVEVLRSACADFPADPDRAGPLLAKYTGHFFRCCAPVEAYAQLARPLADQGFKVLFFTDSPDTSDAFASRFGGPLSLADALAPSHLSGLQRALFELLIMSRCHTILGTKSLFGNLAAAIGGAAFTDARYHSTAEDFLAAYREAIDPQDYGPQVRAAIREAVVRKVNDIHFPERIWGVSDERVRVLLGADG